MTKEQAVNVLYDKLAKAGNDLDKARMYTVWYTTLPHDEARRVSDLKKAQDHIQAVAIMLKDALSLFPLPTE